MLLPILAKTLSSALIQITSIGTPLGPAALPIFIFNIACSTSSDVMSGTGPMFGFSKPHTQGFSLFSNSSQ